MARSKCRYRKFGWLRNYALLHLQDELAALEDELADFDRWDFSDGDPRRLVSRRVDYERPDSRRREIMAIVHSKLKEYGTLTALLPVSNFELMQYQTKRCCEHKRFRPSKDLRGDLKETCII